MSMALGADLPIEPHLRACGAVAPRALNALPAYEQLQSRVQRLHRGECEARGGGVGARADPTLAAEA